MWAGQCLLNKRVCVQMFAKCDQFIKLKRALKYLEFKIKNSILLHRVS